MGGEREQERRRERRREGRWVCGRERQSDGGREREKERREGERKTDGGGEGGGRVNLLIDQRDAVASSATVCDGHVPLHRQL